MYVCVCVCARACMRVYMCVCVRVWHEQIKDVASLSRARKAKCTCHMVVHMHTW